MASRTSSGWDATADGRSPVAKELAAIFAPLPRLESPADPAPTPPPARLRKSGLRAWLLFLGAVALLALIASVLFLMPVAQQIPFHSPAKRTSQKAPTPVVIPAHVEPAPPSTTPVAPTPVAPTLVRETPAPRSTQHRGCPRFAAPAWCMRGTIMGADDQLRDAYEAAVRAGVDRDLLVDVRSDWKRLRGRANHDPQALIRGYAQLTQELRIETARARQ